MGAVFGIFHSRLSTASRSSRPVDRELASQVATGPHEEVKFFMRNRLSFLPLSCLLMFSLAGCSSSTNAPVSTDDPFQQAEENLSPLASTCTFVASSGLMTVNVAAGETAIISRRAADSAILQNGASCDNLATSSTLKKLMVVGAAGG